MKNWIMIAVLAATTFSCAPKKNADTPPSEVVTEESSEDNLIIGGHLVTKKNEIAATTVSLLDARQGTLCTASILSDDVALTAAHCIDGDPNDMQLSFGPKSSGLETRPIVEMMASTNWGNHRHDEFNNGDIALVKFSGGLPKGTVPATLMKTNHHLSDGEIVTLAGFGITNGSGAGAGRLRSVEVKIAKAHYSQTEVSIDQTKRKGACHGDSGGPAFIQDNNGGLQIWGITSRGINDPSNHCVGESVYTRIQPYARWINSIVRKWRK